MSNISLMQFRPCFHVEIIDFKQLVLFSEDEHHLLQGTIYVAIAHLIHKFPKSENKIIEALAEKFPIGHIREALERLKKKKFITEYFDNTPKNFSAFMSDLKLDSNEETNKFISIKNFTSHDSSDLVKAFESFNLKTKESGDFFIAVVDNYICEELENFNRERLKDRKPWMLLKPSGRIIWIGPIFNSNNSGCWNCLSEKIKENRRVEVDLFGAKNCNLNIPSLSFSPITHNIAMSMAAIEVLKWEKSHQSHLLFQNLLTFDLGKMETRLHPFKSLITCTFCQESSKSINHPPNLKLSPKKYYFNEGERNCSLDETLENLNEVISPITGIISTIRHKIVNDEHVCYTVRTLPIHNKLHYNSANRYIRIPDMATGKGKTELQAKVGCIAEAIERYNCTFINQNEIRCCYLDIKDDAIHPSTLLNFSEAQYENRDEINFTRSDFNKIPKRYDGSEIGWTSAYSMTKNQFRYIPSSYCYLHYPYEKDVEMCPGNSNGCASGNSLEESIFYAILELVERDAVAIWWYNRIRRPSVDLKAINDKSLNEIQNGFKKINREIHVLDITTDIQIPCFAAVSWKLDGTEVFFGTGSHLQPNIAISRAISELNQIMIRENTPKNINLMSISSIERDLVKWLITEKINDHPHLKPYGMCIPKFMHSDSKDFLLDINLCIQILKDLELEVFLFDLTNPNIKFHTTRVIIPGLRHFWSRLGPGRLYDTPLDLGWLRKPLLEHEMNPIPYFL